MTLQSKYSVWATGSVNRRGCKTVKTAQDKNHEISAFHFVFTSSFFWRDLPKIGILKCIACLVITSSSTGGYFSTHCISLSPRIKLCIAAFDYGRLNAEVIGCMHLLPGKCGSLAEFKPFHMDPIRARPTSSCAYFLPYRQGVRQRTLSESFPAAAEAAAAHALSGMSFP